MPEAVFIMPVGKENGPASYIFHHFIHYPTAVPLQYSAQAQLTAFPDKVFVPDIIAQLRKHGSRHPGQFQEGDAQPQHQMVMILKQQSAFRIVIGKQIVLFLCPALFCKR